MSKDRAPKEILKDKRTLLEKAREEAIETMEKADDMLKQFIKKSKSKNRGNPKEAGASIEVTKVKTKPKGIKDVIKTSPGQGLTDFDKMPTRAKAGGLMEATARLKAKGMKEGGAVKKDKTVAIDKSPNSGLITVKGFGAGRRT